MNRHKPVRHLRTVIEQACSNQTSWIGHRPGDMLELVSGQTFLAETDGDLGVIEVFSSKVTEPGKVILTFHEFHPEKNTWGEVLGTAWNYFERADNGKWVAFDLFGVRLEKGKSYGFQLQCTRSYIGVGEAAGNPNEPPFKSGHEWHFNALDRIGQCISYFSLAFRVGLST